MSTFQSISGRNKTTSKSQLNQLVDVIQSDISGSSTRKKYQVFVAGGNSLSAVTSSLFQTVHDQDHTLQTSNPIFDMTVGLFYSGSIARGSSFSGVDSTGKLTFSDRSLMMREKINIYKQHAQVLLGNFEDQFVSPYGNADAANKIDAALFLDFKRLFVRDNIKKETFAMKLYQTASHDTTAGGTEPSNVGKRSTVSMTSERGDVIYSDRGSLSNRRVAYGGEVGNIVLSTDASKYVGLIFYDYGIVVLDMARAFANQHVSGVISSTNNTAGVGFSAGEALIGNSLYSNANANATFLPDLVVSASIDDIIDHVAVSRFSSGSLTALTYQNATFINSSIIFCRASPSQCNYSGNPTYVDSYGKIRVVDDESDMPFSYVTSVGLYDSTFNLVAIAKLSRPVLKTPETDLSIRVRLDF